MSFDKLQMANNEVTFLQYTFNNHIIKQTLTHLFRTLQFFGIDIFIQSCPYVECLIQLNQKNEGFPFE